MLRKVLLTSNPRDGGGELGLEDCLIGLCRLQYSCKELRLDGLLGVILPRFILLAKELVNVLLGSLRNTRERESLRVGGTRRSIVTLQKRGRKIRDQS
jgi:hypothetical protein